MDLNTDPHFAPEAQESFVPGGRVFAVSNTTNVREGAEGIYRGHLNKRVAVVDWDTPSGEGFREAVGFDVIKNLYR
jgi:hypothetical protein